MTVTEVPRLPPPLGNLSVWQRTVRDHPLLNARKDENLPESADIVVVGGGLTGAVLSHALLYPEEHNYEGENESNGHADKPRVVLLEARELASGASGRNAGHCRPDAARGFPMFAAIHGGPEARHILESEAEVLKRVDTFVKAHKLDCEWTPRETYDVFLSPEFSAYSAKALAGLKAVGGDPDLTMLSPAEAAAAAQIDQSKVYGAARWPAATANPAKLCLGILSLCEDSGRFAAYAYAPVVSVDAESGKWRVSTPKGSILADKVVFATNAYTDSSRLVPALEGLIKPVRAQAHKLRPSDLKLDGSYSLRFGLHEFYSSCPRADGSVVLGGGRHVWPKDVSGNNTDDSAWLPVLARNSLRAWSELHPGHGWEMGESDEMDEAALVTGTTDVPLDIKGAEGLEYGWQGIIGFTPDNVPLIGAVPKKEGQYVAAGYCGHGMARIFVTAPALARYIRTGEWDKAMPKSFRITEERLQKLREMPQASAGK